MFLPVPNLGNITLRLIQDRLREGFPKRFKKKNNYLRTFLSVDIYILICHFFNSASESLIIQKMILKFKINRFI